MSYSSVHLSLRFLFLPVDIDSDDVGYFIGRNGSWETFTIDTGYSNIDELGKIR